MRCLVHPASVFLYCSDDFDANKRSFPERSHQLRKPGIVRQRTAERSVYFHIVVLHQLRFDFVYFPYCDPVERASCSTISLYSRKFQAIPTPPFAIWQGSGLPRRHILSSPGWSIASARNCLSQYGNAVHMNPPSVHSILKVHNVSE